MNSFRVARTALRACSAAVRTPLQRRGYADAVSDKIKLTLALPHQVRPYLCQSLHLHLDGNRARLGSTQCYTRTGSMTNMLTSSVFFSQSTSPPMCTSKALASHTATDREILVDFQQVLIVKDISVQVNIPAESGEMGVLANHVPSIEQLKPGLVEIIEESGGSKQFFRTLEVSDTHGSPNAILERPLPYLDALFKLQNQRWRIPGSTS